MKKIKRNLFGKIRKNELSEAEKYIADFYVENGDIIPDPEYPPCALINYSEAELLLRTVQIREKLLNEQQEHLKEERRRLGHSSASSVAGVRYSVKEPSAYGYLVNAIKDREESFSDSLLRIIDSKNLTDPEVYTKADVSRQVFNNIKNNPDYHPSKETIIRLSCTMFQYLKI